MWCGACARWCPYVWVPRSVVTQRTRALVPTCAGAAQCWCPCRPLPQDQYRLAAAGAEDGPREGLLHLRGACAHMQAHVQTVGRRWLRRTQACMHARMPPAPVPTARAPRPTPPCAGIASRWLVDADNEEDEEGGGDDGGERRRRGAGAEPVPPSTSSPTGSGEGQRRRGMEGVGPGGALPTSEAGDYELDSDVASPSHQRSMWVCGARGGGRAVQRAGCTECGAVWACLYVCVRTCAHLGMHVCMRACVCVCVHVRGLGQGVLQLRARNRRKYMLCAHGMGLACPPLLRLSLVLLAAMCSCAAF